MPFHSEPEGRAGLASAEFQIRRAVPEDSAFLAEVILMASRSQLPRGFWDLVVSEEDLLDFLELLTLIDGKSYCNFSNFLIGESEATPVSALSAYDPGEPGLMSPGQLIAAAWEDLGWQDEELVDIYQRLEPYRLGLPEQRAGLWTIEWVATVESRRKRGHITAMMESILDEGRSKGYTRAQVTTFIGNDRASRGYQRIGFRMAEEKRHPDFEKITGAPGMARFERSL